MRCCSFDETHLVKFSLWWKDTAWLSSSMEAWPQQKIQSFQSNCSAQPATTGIDTARTVSDWQSRLLTRISSWTRLLRITAYFMRAVKIFREKVVVSRYLSAAEIR